VLGPETLPEATLTSHSAVPVQALAGLGTVGQEEAGAGQFTVKTNS
jgi:hypothetical protein